MAHISKIKSSACYGLLQHDFRLRTGTLKRENIDATLSKNNEYFTNERFREMTPFDIYKQKLKGVDKVLKRKDVNHLGGVVISLPQDLDRKYEKDFFKFSMDFLNEKLNTDEDRFVSAAIHYDEPSAQPHLHYKFMPIYRNPKTNKTTLNINKFLPRAFYREFHTQLKNYIEDGLKQKYGIDISVNVLNGKTKGVKTVEDLKKLDDINNEIAEKQEELQDFEPQIEYKHLLEKHNKSLDEFSERSIEYTHKIMEKDVKSPQNVKTIKILKKEYVPIQTYASLWDKLADFSWRSNIIYSSNDSMLKIERENKESIERDLKNLQERFNRVENINNVYSKNNSRLERTNSDLKNYINDLEVAINRLGLRRSINEEINNIKNEKKLLKEQKKMKNEKGIEKQKPKKDKGFEMG